MNLKKIIFFIYLFSANAVFAQNFSINWDKTFGGISRDWNCSVIKSPANKIFLIGDSETNIDGDKSVPLCNNQLNQSDVWLIKADTSGAIIWQRDFGGDADERSPRLVLLNNPAGEMIFSCYSTSAIACDKSEPNRDTVPLISADYWIALLDSNGMIIWEKTLGGDNYDDYTQITQLSTGEFLVCGESNSPIGYDKTVANHSISNDYWVVKLDANGNIIADYVYGGDGGEFLTSVIADDQGGFLLAGSTNSDVSGDVSQPTQGNLDFWMIKVDNQGNKVWDRRFGGIGPDQCNYAIQTNDNGFLLCGFTVSPQGGDVSEPPKGSQDYWVVKTDSMGVKQWDKRFGGTAGSFGTHAALSDSGYWVSGYSNSTNVLDVSEPSYGGSDYWILKLDSAGNKLFDKRFGGNNNEFNTSLMVLNDTTFMAFGYSDSGSSAVKNAPSKGFFDYWLVKFNYNAITTGIESYASDNESHIILYPNPTEGIVYITINSGDWTPENVEIIDISGKVVANHLLTDYKPGVGFYEDYSELNKGFYFLNFNFKDHKSIVKKLVIR